MTINYVHNYHADMALELMVLCMSENEGMTSNCKEKNTFMDGAFTSDQFEDSCFTSNIHKFSSRCNDLDKKT